MQYLLVTKYKQDPFGSQQEVSPMSTLRKLTLDLELGQTILVGQGNKPATITKIEYHENSGEISINTTRGPRKALTFRLVDAVQPVDDPADRYR